MEVKQIEKQTMKLKLDTMIIQKGRAQNNKTSFGKDDYKDMVNSFLNMTSKPDVYIMVMPPIYLEDGNTWRH